MPTTIKRQLIIDAIKTRFALILVAGGYYTNLGQKLTERKPNPFGANRVDGIDISDPDENNGLAAEDQSVEQHELTLVIKAIAKSPVDASTGRKMEADIKKAIAVDSTWGGLAARTHPENSKMEVEQNDVKILGVVITITIQYDTAAFLES